VFDWASSPVYQEPSSSKEGATFEGIVEEREGGRGEGETRVAHERIKSFSLLSVVPVAKGQTSTTAARSMTEPALFCFPSFVCLQAVRLAVMLRAVRATDVPTNMPWIPPVPPRLEEAVKRRRRRIILEEEMRTRMADRAWVEQASSSKVLSKSCFWAHRCEHVHSMDPCLLMVPRIIFSRVLTIPCVDQSKHGLSVEPFLQVSFEFSVVDPLLAGGGGSPSKDHWKKWWVYWAWRPSWESVLLGLHAHRATPSCVCIWAFLCRDSGPWSPRTRESCSGSRRPTDLSSDPTVLTKRWTKAKAPFSKDGASVTKRAPASGHFGFCSTLDSAEVHSPRGQWNVGRFFPSLASHRPASATGQKRVQH